MGLLDRRRHDSQKQKTGAEEEFLLHTEAPFLQESADLPVAQSLNERVAFLVFQKGFALAEGFLERVVLGEEQAQELLLSVDFANGF